MTFRTLLLITGLIAGSNVSEITWASVPLPDMPGRPAIGEKHSVSTGDVEHVYYERGAGPVIALLPSLGRPASDFNELTTALSSAGFRTIAIDLNLSRKESADSNESLLHLATGIEAIFASLGLNDTEQVFVLGHAFGNRLARTYATIHPEQVRAVILLAAGGRVPIAPDIRTSLRDCFDPGISEAARSHALRQAFFAKNSHIPDYWRMGWDRSLAKIQIQATRTTPYEKWWGAGGVPMLVIQGDEDAIAPPAHTSELLKDEFDTRVTVATASPAGHALLPEQADFIASTIIAYLNSATSGIIP